MVSILFPLLPFWHFSSCLQYISVFSVKNESTRRIAWTNWLVQPLTEKCIILFFFSFHMALLRRKEELCSSVPQGLVLSTRKPWPRSSWLVLHEGQFTFVFPGEKVYGSWAEVRFCDACSADSHQVFKLGCGLWDHRSKIKQFWVTTLCMNLFGFGFQRTQRFKANTRRRLETCSTYSLQKVSK